MKTISLPDALADALTAALGAQATATVDYSEVWDPPRHIVVNGCNIMARAPLNPAWQPSSAESIFGQSGNISMYAAVGDPSNGDGVTKALRSAGGFPLFWAGDTPYLYHRGACFPNDASVLADIKRAADAQVGAQAKWDATTGKLKDRQQGEKI